jgi:hypothetical protein
LGIEGKVTMMDLYVPIVSGGGGGGVDDEGDDVCNRIGSGEDYDGDDVSSSGGHIYINVKRRRSLFGMIPSNSSSSSRLISRKYHHRHLFLTWAVVVSVVLLSEVLSVTNAFTQPGKNCDILRVFAWIII